MSWVKTNIWLQYAFHAVCFVGVCASIYALAVEFQKDSDPNYKPMCDLSEGISCTKALMSKWSKGFGLIGPILGEDHILNQRNPIYGIFAYTLLMILASINSISIASIVIWIVVASNLMSIYLAGVLYWEVKSLCIVCLSTYIVNFILLPLSYWRRSVLRKLNRKKRT